MESTSGGFPGASSIALFDGDDHDRSVYDDRCVGLGRAVTSMSVARLARDRPIVVYHISFMLRGRHVIRGCSRRVIEHGSVCRALRSALRGKQAPIAFGAGRRFECRTAVRAFGRTTTSTGWSNDTTTANQPQIANTRPLGAAAAA